MAPINYLLLVQRLYRIREAFKEFQFILKRKFSHSFFESSFLICTLRFDKNFIGLMKIPFPALCVLLCFLLSNVKL